MGIPQSEEETVYRLSLTLAQTLRSSVFTTGHVLFGLLWQGEGVAAQALAAHAVAPDRLLAILKESEQTPIYWQTVRRYQRPLTARRLGQIAYREAWMLGHAKVASEHLLLGLLRNTDSEALRALHRLGVNPAHLRQTIFGLIRQAPPREQVAGLEGEMTFEALSVTLLPVKKELAQAS